ncbi:MAG TPA: glycine/sarcosine/betaine reductase selenoprotein B family protein [Thermoanaerobaculia bacterium]|nr:glycine/sarcosine/betaine reductase selenoprotein B family protein [Thermoanaerobaculia bacterium]
MAEISDLPLASRLFLKAYPWRRIDPLPWSPLRKPLPEARLALVSTAGLVLPGQAPFDERVRGGDYSYREIPDDADVSTLIDSHRSGTYDHSGVQADPNVGFPLDRLHELGLRTNARHFSFMGSLTAPGRLVRETAPEAAEKLVADGVDAVLLIPI